MAKRGDRNAFFYGTLMAPEILQNVLSHWSPQKKVRDRLTIRPAILHNYCRHKILYADYPGMIEEQGKSVRGTLVQGLTGDDVRNLDAFEGSEYERVWVEVGVLEEKHGQEHKEGDGKGDGKGDGDMGVELTEGEQISAETYVFIGGEDRLERKEWDYEEFRREKLRHWGGGSKEYDDIDALDNVLRDHDPTGGRANFQATVEDVDEDLEEKIKSAV